MNGDVHTYWQLQDVSTGKYSVEIFQSEDEASMRAARLNKAINSELLGSTWVVVSFEGRED